MTAPTDFASPETPTRSALGQSAGSVVFGPPPHTGAQKCCSCGGWIISDVSYWGGTAGPFCTTCWGVPSSYSPPNTKGEARCARREKTHE